MPSVVTIGELCGVFVAKEIGRMRYCRDYTIRPGGAEATVAAGVTRLGFDAGWISVFGEDEMGHLLLNLLRGEGVDTSLVKMLPGKNTSVFLRERLPGGNARHFYYRKGSAFTYISPDILDEDYIASAKYLHLTGITPALSESAEATMWKAVEIAKAHGVKFIFDPNVRLSLWSREKARETIEKFLSAADIVMPGLEDLQMLCGSSMTMEEALAHLKSLGCKNIILKNGVKEVLVDAEGVTESVPIVPLANPLDLMGAGDSFAAGFIAGLLREMSYPDAVRLGNLVARCAIQMPGNIEALPSWAEVSRIMNKEVVYNR